MKSGRFHAMIAPAALVILFVSAPLASAATTAPVLAATVNIYNATTTAQSGNTLTIAFDISNGAGVQPGVKYGVLLTEGSFGNQKIIDEHVYDDVLNLGENSSLHKVITYTAPIGLSGTYDLSLSAKSSSGFPFGTSDLGKVTFTGSTAGTVFIDKNSCDLTVGTDPHKYALSDEIALSANTTLTGHCSVQNNTAQTVILTPTFVTRKYGVYGDIVAPGNATNTPVTLAPKEVKTVAFQVPLANFSQTYAATFSLSDASGAIVSNAVVVTYMVAGAGQASILSGSLDKSMYRAGDTATLSVFWNSSPGIASTTLAISMTNKSGTPCISPISYPIATSGDSYAIIPAKVVSDCIDPQLSVSLKSPTLGTLDAREFTITSSSTPSTTPTQSIPNSWYLWLAGALLVIVAGIAAYFLKAKMKILSL